MALHDLGDYIAAIGDSLTNLFDVLLNPVTFFFFCLVLIPINYLWSWIQLSDEARDEIESTPLLQRPISKRFPRNFWMTIAAHAAWLCLYLYLCFTAIVCVLSPVHLYLDKEREMQKYVFMRQNDKSGAMELVEPYESEYQKRLESHELNTAD